MASQTDQNKLDLKKRNEVYDKNRVEKLADLRKKRKDEKIRAKNGESVPKLLGFITHIYTELGYTRSTFAQANDMSEQMMYWYLGLKDDCALSKAQEMLENIGVKLTYSLEKRSDLAADASTAEIDLSSDDFGIRGSLPRSLIKNSETVAPLFDRSIRKQGRLAPLAKVICDKKLLAVEAAKMLGTDGASLILWFDVKDDMRISKIKELADKLGYNLKWEVSAK